MNDAPLDFSLLDPSRDAARWQARIDSVVAETIRRRHRRLGMVGLVERYARAALAIAAAIALVSWAGAAQFVTKTASSTVVHPTSALLVWATNDEVPSTSEVFQSLGVQHVND
jgi:hypothetical protein